MEKEQKENLIKIIVSSILLMLSYMLEKNRVLSNTGILIVYIVTYIYVSYETILEVLGNILKIAHKEHNCECSKDHEGFSLFDENFLMVVASIGAFFLGDYLEAVLVILLFSIGEFFEDFAVEKSKDNIKDLMDIRPDFANILVLGTLKRVSPESVNVGDVIIVNPGEKVPLDGVVLKVVNMETGKVDTSSLTGESKLRDIVSGEEILSGIVNASLTNRELLEEKEKGLEGKVLKGALEIKVTKAFSESTVSKILKMVEDEENNKSNPEHFITKFSKVYTPIVCILAVLIFLIPSLITKDFNTFLYRALTFLVVSCPCALVISIPLCFFSGIGGASKEGILIKGSTYLELLSKASIVAFDKTGTLTIGNVNSEDELKPTTKEAIANLKKLGIRYTIMLTGDYKNIALKIKEEAGISKAIYELLPDSKVKEVKKLVNDKKSGDVVVYVGDGINDAPSLIAADIGISMGLNGSDSAIEASDVVLMDDDPIKIGKAIKISRKTMAIVKENISFSILVKLLFLVLSGLGITSMGLAVFSDVGVMIIAVLNSMRALITRNI